MEGVKECEITHKPGVLKINTALIKFTIHNEINVRRWIWHYAHFSRVNI